MREKEVHHYNFLKSICYSHLSNWKSVLPMKKPKKVYTCLIKHGKIFVFYNCSENNTLFSIYDIKKGVWTKEVGTIFPMAQYAVC